VKVDASAATLGGPATHEAPRHALTLSCGATTRFTCPHPIYELIGSYTTRKGNA
jgi:hypothetical protein